MNPLQASSDELRRQIKIANGVVKKLEAALHALGEFSAQEPPKSKSVKKIKRYKRGGRSHRSMGLLSLHWLRIYTEFLTRDSFSIDDVWQYTRESKIPIKRASIGASLYEATYRGELQKIRPSVFKFTEAGRARINRELKR